MSLHMHRYNESDKLGIAIACLGVGVAMLLALITFSPQEYLPIIIIFLLFLLCASAIYPLFHFLKRRWLAWLVLALLVGGSAKWGIAIWPNPPGFSEVRAKHGWRLGPKETALPMKVSETGYAYQARFEHATHLWTETGAYVLWDTGMWERLSESTFPREDNWWNDKWLKDRFHSPAPPVGSMAYAWDHDPGRWMKMGLMDFQCQTVPNVYYQEFQNGSVIGIFRARMTGDDAFVYVLFNDRQWYSLPLHGAPNIANSLCSEPNS